VGMSWSEFENLAITAEGLKKDYEVPTNKIHAVYLNGDGKPEVKLHLENTNTNYRLGTVAHDNLSTMAGIPRQYYNRLLTDHPRELAGLLEMHLHKDEQPEARFVRTIGGKVRALLSTKYGVIDHIDVARMIGANL